MKLSPGNSHGSPAFKFRNEFKKHNIKVFSSNYPLYGDMSHRVMKILETYTPNVEIYSIDEAFLSSRALIILISVQRA